MGGLWTGMGFQMPGLHLQLEPSQLNIANKIEQYIPYCATKFVLPTLPVLHFSSQNIAQLFSLQYISKVLQNCFVHILHNTAQSLHSIITVFIAHSVVMDSSRQLLHDLGAFQAPPGRRLGGWASPRRQCASRGWTRITVKQPDLGARWFRASRPSHNPVGTLHTCRLRRVDNDWV